MALFSDLPSGDLREIVRQFTPNWFAANMGTGILALMVGAFPYPFWGQSPLAQGLWIINGLFFCLFAGLFLGRAIFYPASFRRLFGHPVQSLFIGAIPMGLATIINGGLLLWPPSGPALEMALVFWWVDVALSVLSVVVVPYFMFTAQEHAIERMTAAWLLPIVPPEVAAASGGLLAPHLATEGATMVIYISYVLWAISVPLALGILTILFLRLTLHKLPHADMAVSAWLPLGPLGTGALALVLLGDADTQAFAATPLTQLAAFGQTGGIFIAFLLWGFGLWWMAMAGLFTLRYVQEGLPFNMGWWGFTFPLGVYTAATFALAHDTDFGVFAPLGAGFTLLLAFFWVLVTWRSFQGMWSGQLFHAPCLSEETGLLEGVCPLPPPDAGPDLLESLKR